MLLDVPKPLVPVAFKEQVKASLRDHPRLFTFVDTLYSNAQDVRHVSRFRLGRTLLGWRQPAGTPRNPRDLRVWNVPLPPWSGAADLIASLRARDIAVREAVHTFYLAPQPALRRLMPAIVDEYPPPCGFKILRDCRHPSRARYLYKHRLQRPLLRRLIGAPVDQIAPANYMHALGIGPRVHELIGWTSGGRYCSVFAVEHVEGRPPTAAEYEGFIQALNEAFLHTRLRPLAPLWEGTDFAPPDCNGNLIYSEALARVQYVDFQNFGLA